MLIKTEMEETATAHFIAQSAFEGRFAGVGANGQAVVLTIEAPLGNARNAFHWLHYSYNATPTNGSITITDGTVTETIFITAAGPGHLPFEGAVFAKGAAVTVTLASGGAAVRGSLALLGVRAL